MLVAGYGFALLWRADGRARTLAIAIVATFASYFIATVFLQESDSRAQHFGQRRYVDLFFALCVALGPAIATIRSAGGTVFVQSAAIASVAIAALGTVAPLAGAPGESGFAFGTREFVALYNRAPAQAILDVILLAALLLLVLRVLRRALKEESPWPSAEFGS